ncbi:hypothetical protein NDU88_003074 [Pleurodeles waltl]|uniref:Uncharacterized protein n=1 Tax=Pleurodeles waltl TaxID=8319 RepID=A0AAV7MRF6_PLEWA|nr:hypothetical protein NDU88_003074 [Pleurodeles waltl]
MGVRSAALALVGGFGALSRGSRRGLAARTPQPHQHPQPVRPAVRELRSCSSGYCSFPQMSGPLAGSSPIANGSDNLGKRPPATPQLTPAEAARPRVRLAGAPP